MMLQLFMNASPTMMMFLIVLIVFSGNTGISVSISGILMFSLSPGLTLGMLIFSTLSAWTFVSLTLISSSLGHFYFLQSTFFFMILMIAGSKGVLQGVIFMSMICNLISTYLTTISAQSTSFLVISQAMLSKFFGISVMILSYGEISATLLTMFFVLVATMAVFSESSVAVSFSLISAQFLLGIASSNMGISSQSLVLIYFLISMVIFFVNFESSLMFSWMLILMVAGAPMVGMNLVKFYVLISSTLFNGFLYFIFAFSLVSAMMTSSFYMIQAEFSSSSPQFILFLL